MLLSVLLVDNFGAAYTIILLHDIHDVANHENAIQIVTNFGAHGYVWEIAIIILCDLIAPLGN